MKRVMLAAIALAVASPASAEKFFAVTPTGMAETVFADKPSVVIGKLSSKCIDQHWTVTTSTDTELTCEAPMSFGQSLLGTLMMGNSYSTPPRRFFRFNVALLNGVSRVQASGWMELQMALGQTRRTDFNGPGFENGIVGFMVAAGGHYPVGTTFPNHAILGVKGDVAANGLQVTSVEPQSAAERAGVQSGDVITTIANKRFKNESQYLDAAAKAAESSTYVVTVDRAGQKLTLNAERVFRPTIMDAVVAAVDSPPVAQPVVSPLSTADEIAKLAALRDKGIITMDDFLAQKRKLLGN